MHHIMVGGERTSCYSSLEHGAKDDRSLGALVALISCQLLQMSMQYFYHVVIFCTQHVQLILISNVEKGLQNNEIETFLRD